MTPGNFDEAVWKRGRSYFRQGRVWHRIRGAGRLEARVLGGEGQTYEAWFDPESGKGWCVCPVGAEGRCKHVAALLLAWEAEPKTFREVPELKGPLSRSFEARFLSAEGPLEASVYERVLGTIRRLSRQGSDKAADLLFSAWKEARLLEPALRLALERGLWRVILESGEEPWAWEPGVSHLARALTFWPEAVREDDRAETAELLLDLFRYALDREEELAEIAARVLLRVVDERVADRLASRVYALLEGMRGPAAKRVGRLYEALLARAGERLKSDARARLLERSRRWRDLFDHWLGQGEVERALEVLANSEEVDPAEAVLAFVERGLAETAREALKRRPGWRRDVSTLFALWRVNEALGDGRALLETLEALFLRTESPDVYRAFREVAERTGNWPAVRACLRERLLREGRVGLAFSLDLEDGAFADAASLWPEIRHWIAAHDPWLIASFLKESERLFEGLLKQDPLRASALAQELVAYLVRLRARPYYARAARIARAVWDALQDDPKAACWVFTLPERYPRLRALHEELSNVGLDKAADRC